MAVSYPCHNCAPQPIALGDMILPGGEPHHEACIGSQTQPGVLGGYVCNCPCRRQKPPVCTCERYANGNWGCIHPPPCPVHNPYRPDSSLAERIGR